MIALDPAKRGDKWNKNKDAKCASRQLISLPQLKTVAPTPT